MSQHYEEEFKRNIVRLHIEEGRTYRSLTAEYGVSKAAISKWCSQFSKECQEKALQNPDALNEFELMKENHRLREELAEAQKENLFLKKRRHSLQRKSISRFIDKNKQELGTRWFLKRLDIYPNAYYNYRQHRKADYYTQKQVILNEINTIYHDNNGVTGYRSMTVYLARKGFKLSH